MLLNKNPIIGIENTMTPMTWLIAIEHQLDHCNPFGGDGVTINFNHTMHEWNFCSDIHATTSPTSIASATSSDESLFDITK
jgi:hypothetical protein